MKVLPGFDAGIVPRLCRGSPPPSSQAHLPGRAGAWNSSITFTAGAKSLFLQRNLICGNSKISCKCLISLNFSYEFR
jgi:hypothetical protein